MTMFLWSSRSLRPLSLLLSISLHLISGLAREPSNPTDANKAVTPEKSRKSNIGVTVLIVFLGVLATVGFAVVLFKLWQKKKREEQHARLLKLFEDDDELEVELGIQD
ncbi:hypothetical protein Tsubulata_029857 [Turnera subulata]|uniref:Transmembrane protein n=1 Tax=Turnera subulata TaxID=218843 RepID=A0A9Q0F9D5_9ROSI|nr:hypothetical protein Tsubulata_029857 [Turnera subulata]